MLVLHLQRPSAVLCLELQGHRPEKSTAVQLSATYRRLRSCLVPARSVGLHTHFKCDERFQAHKHISDHRAFFTLFIPCFPFTRESATIVSGRKKSAFSAHADTRPLSGVRLGHVLMPRFIQTRAGVLRARRRNDVSHLCSRAVHCYPVDKLPVEVDRLMISLVKKYC